MSTQIERAAHRLWRAWGGAWARFTVCSSCGTATYCCASRRRGPFLCVDCFDQSPQAQLTLKRERST